MDLLDSLTPEKIAVATGSTLEAAKQWVLYFQVVLPSYKITTTERIAAFLSQVGVESANLTAVVENLNYSASGLASTWPVRYAEKNIFGKYVMETVNGRQRYTPNGKALLLNRNPEAIANHCYANRMGNGSEAGGDGWRYRGRGLKQLTGRDNYLAFAEYSGVDVITYPDKLLEPGYATISACWFWQTNKLETLADRCDVAGLTKIINGGTNGLVARQALFNKAIEVC